MHIVEGGLDDPRVIKLIHTHVSVARALKPDSSHALDLSYLRAPHVTFWSAWEHQDDAEILVGVGALKELDSGHGEVKSMHIAEAWRGRGRGGALLRHIISIARARGMSRLSLDTGTWPYFAPARALYARHGFVECPPYGDYEPDPNIVFMTLAPIDATD
jgi:putative acetyltransferase